MITVTRVNRTEERCYPSEEAAVGTAENGSEYFDSRNNSNGCNNNYQPSEMAAASNGKHKTEMCRFWSSGQACRFGASVGRS